MAEAADHPSVAAADLPTSPLIPNLPDDISVLCIARVPRSSHPNLALVSRSYRSLLRSPLLSAARSALSATSPSLFLNLRTPTDQSRWFLLDPHPHLRFRPLPPPPIPTLGSACAALGPSLFLLGGSRAGIPSSAVQIFNPIHNSWTSGPRMAAAREFAAAAAVSGRIYAVGGCLPPSDSWAEYFDPASSAWMPVPSPPHIREKWIRGSAVLAGRLLAVADRGGVVFDPPAAWGAVSAVLDSGWRGRAAVVDGILYTYDYLGKIKGYDPAADQWRPVEGMERELPKFLCGATLADLGGILCLVWEGCGRGNQMAIECAGIAVARTSYGGLRGSLAWRESAFLPIPNGSAVAHCVALEF